MACHHSNERRGVILLLVLILLSLFTVMALMFVLVATQHRARSTAFVRGARATDGHESLLDDAFKQVVRGTNNPLSAIGPHSLLEDEFGNDGRGNLFVGAATVANSTGGQMLLVTPTVQLSGVSGYFNGRILSMRDGPLADQTTRILGYNAVTNQLLLLAFPIEPYGRDGMPGVKDVDDDGNGTIDDVSETFWSTSDDLPHPGDQFLINGRPFNGVGFGYNAGEPFTDANGNGIRDGGESYTDVNGNGAYDAPTGVVDRLDPLGREYALLPFAPSELDPLFQAYQTYRNGRDNIPGTADDGLNADEDYDAVDFQNMLLGARMWNVMKNRWEVALPTLFRPDLIAYWIERYRAAGANLFDPLVVRSILSRIMPRPLNIGPNNPATNPNNPHPKFTGGNRNWNLTDLTTDNNSNSVPDSLERLSLDIDGDGFPDVVYDVDNDGDGNPDSIWVDLGMPVQTGKNGQLYKPLFAILVEDMDGKLNLNAHGSGFHYRVNGNAPPMANEEYVTRNDFASATPRWAGGPYGGAGPAYPFVPVGMGMSVADVNLGAAQGVLEPLFGQPIHRLLPFPYYNSGLGMTVNEYRFLQQGKGPMGTEPAVAGKWGEVHRLMSPGPSPLAGFTTTGPLAAPYGYGADGAPGVLGFDDDNNGTVDDPGERGWAGSDDLWDGDDNSPAAPMAYVLNGPMSAQIQLRGNYYHEGNFRATALGPNGTPGDPEGKAATYLDARGQPIYIWPSWVTGAPEGVDEPTELNLSQDALAAAPGLTGGDTIATDMPFGPDEFEPILRYSDADRDALPGRLQALAPSLLGQFQRHLVTTHSFDLPSPNIQATKEVRNLMLSVGVQPTNLHLTDLLTAKLLNGGVPVAAINSQLALMLGQDIVAGLRLDINRPLGNNRDDDGDGVIDDPDESIQTGPLPSGGTGPIERLWMNAAGAIDGFAFDHNGDGTLDVRDMLARHLLARRLYVLAMLLTDSGYLVPVTEAGLTPVEQQELTARRLAQWAINVVDFRDRDSIMTPFEYDVNPFNGWTVDGFVQDNPAGNHPGPDGEWGVFGVDDNGNGIVGDPGEAGWGGSDDLAADWDTSTNAERRVAWGCEYPDLLLTETMAGHDRRTEDLASAGTGKYNPVGTGTDDDFDQARIPQGWTFIELFCTRNANNAASIGDLYRPNGMLDLGKMDPTGTRPVWRLAVARSQQASANNNVANRLLTNPDSTTLDPTDFNLFDAPAVNVTIERYVWFSAVAPPAALPAAERNMTYYNYIGGGAPVLLAPGQYAVVGPHRNPATGASNRTVIGTTTAAPWAQEIRLGDLAATNGAGGRRPVTVNSNNGTNPYPRDIQTTGTPGTFDIQEPLGIAVAGDPAGTANAGWTGGPIGFSISEPLFSSANYYPNPTDPAPTTVTHFDGTTTTYVDRYSPVIDQPFDDVGTRPLGQDSLLDNRTYLNYKAVFLQRLANPVAPYDPVTNPYIAVDWMPIDLTVYNGEYTLLAGESDPNDATSGANIRFSTRERSMRRDPLAATPADSFNIWKQPTWGPGPAIGNPLTDPPDSNPTPGQSAPFAHNLRHTLGFIGEFYRDTTVAGPTGYWTTGTLTTAGYPANYAQAHAGDPAHPFPWLTWNNRPYSSSMELLDVPASSPSRLLYEYDYRVGPPNGPAGSPTRDHYVDRGYPAGGQTPPFGHLLNFFWGSNSLATPTASPGSLPPPDIGGQSNLHRLLEYVHVPSRFSGTDTLLNPAYFNVANGTRLGYDAPFNRVSRYRDPGRVNINTVFDNGATLRAILNDFPGSDTPTLWSDVIRSRRGYVAPIPSQMMAINQNSPTVFANPFRSPASSYNVPIEALRRRNVNISGSGTVRSFSEAGLLRPDPNDTDVTSTPTPQRPLFAPNFAEEFRNTDRNAYFRYQAFQKLGNVLSTRSNVYAVWITVGFFEVERAPVDAFHPDGYQLGPEVGDGSGQTRRHRAFYLFDRSIPVPFERGQNYNFENAVLLRRMVE